MAFFQGITRFNNLITEEQKLAMKAVILEKLEKKELNNESDNVNYLNSYGTSSLPDIDTYYSQLTPQMESFTGLKLKKENSYSRVYNIGSTLTRHLDRENLDLTLSIQIDNTTGEYQTLYAENYAGSINDANLDNRDALLIKGRDLPHWRDNIHGKDGGQLICVFFHWQIMGGEILEVENFLTKATCEKIIEEAEKIGFKKSEVLHHTDKSTGVSDYHRNSSTVWFQDTYGIETLLRQQVPTIGNLKLEGWQLIKYNPGEEFKPHQDCLNKEHDRLFTILINLNDNFEGGQTSFPITGDSITPKTGKLSLWKNLTYQKCYNKSQHAGNPVISGTKMILINWVLAPY